MRFCPGYFDYKAIDLIACKIAKELSIKKVVRLDAGSLIENETRFGHRINYRNDLSRVVLGSLVVREDGSGHGPPQLAKKVIQIVSSNKQT